ncbi:MAG TPA: hypothetical protein DCQ31_00110, partial [Bacteroidales bacterium]|nr:hypothetical protein [Bacteroidales bacterium]
ITVSVTILIAGIAIFMLYLNAKNSLFDRLTDIVNNEKNEIETLLNKYNKTENEVIEHLQYIRIGNSKIGKTGEIAIAKLQNDTLVFIISEKQNVRISIHQTELGSPMHKALQKEKGCLTGKDYRGNNVFASYTYIDKLQWGIVAKISADEIHKPFVEAVTLVFLLALVLVTITTLLIVNIANPVIDALETEKIMLTDANNQLYIKNNVLKANQEELIHQNQELIAAEKEIRAANEELLVTADELKLLNGELSISKEKAEVNETFLNETGEIAKIGGWKIDLANQKLFWTKEVYRIHEVADNYKPIIEKAIDFHDDNSKIVIQKAIDDAIKFGKPFDVELGIITAKGNHIFVRAKGEAQKDNKGTIQFITGAFQDITDKKQAEKELIKTQLLLKSSLESPKDMIILSIDKNYNYLYFNNTHWQSMKYAYNKDISIGMNLLECMTDQNDIEKAKINYSKALQGISHSTIEEFGDTNKSYYESFYNPIYNDKNEIIGATSFARDITERKKAESMLREKDIQFRKLSANVHDLIYQFTRKPDGTYCVPIASEGIKNIFGCSPEDVVDDFTPIARVIFPDDAAAVISDIEYSAKHLTYFTCEFRVQIPGKPVQWILSRSTPEKLDDGSITWYGFNADITERKLQELLLKEKNEESATLNEELRQTLEELSLAKERAEESEIQLKKAQHTAKIGSWVWYIHENKLWWSDEMYNIFEIDKGQFTGELDKVIEEAIHPDDRAAVENSNYSVMVDNKPIPVEYRIKTKGGTDKYVLGIADRLILDENGKSELLTGIVKDITEYKLIQIDLQKSKEKAEESDQLKTAFLENISHEVRTPMNAILGFSKLLLKQTLNEEKKKQYTDMLHKSTNQLLTIVDNSIALAHIETKQLEINKMDFYPASLLSNLLQEYNHKKQIIEKSHIELIFKEPEFPDLQINSDYTRINQIFNTLLDNAFKFTENGSIEFGYTAKDNQINFYVKDTGIGIPIDKQQIIFKSFTQADKNIRQSFGGLGVGLSIALGLVNLLEGELIINSQMNVGTEITFKLPISKKIKQS